MDISFSVAMDQPAERRDFEVAAGNDFRVLLSVYAKDVDDGSLPVDLTGKTLTLKVADCAYPPLTVSAAGAAQTAFVFVPGNTKDACGRLPYTIKMTDNTSGKVTTLAFGAMVVRNADACVWPQGNDYGWRGYGRFV